MACNRRAGSYLYLMLLRNDPMTRMPALFLGHGSPMNAIENNAWTQGWAHAGAVLPRPKAILIISAHWETHGVAVTAGAAPETIHDFFGFPQALFDVRYNAPGDLALARRVVELLSPDPVALDAERGFDHGVWSVLAPMYPDADIPIVQLSIDRGKSDRWHYEAGRRLAPLRDEGVMIVDWRSLGADADLAINSAEHYLPLLYVLGASRADEPVGFFNDEVFAAISMTSVAYGAPSLR
ncbi:MAG: dioxygenase extradiol [Caulobacter sp.]|nr:dioxygenase extradiol [Caulobacter sp.]